MRRSTSTQGEGRRGHRRVDRALGSAALVLIIGVIVWFVVGVHGYARLLPAYALLPATAQGWLVAGGTGPLLMALIVGLWATLTGRRRVCAGALHVAIVLVGCAVLADIVFNVLIFADFELTSDWPVRDLIGTLQVVALVSLLTHIAAGALSLWAQLSLGSSTDTGAPWLGGRWRRWWLEDRR